MELPNSQKPTKQERGWLGLKPTTGKRSSRCTRSQVVPDWTLQELLILVNEVAGIETDFMKSLSSYQKWKLISDNCTSLGVARSLNQCRKQWNQLLDEYRIIKNWEYRSGVSYWSLDRETLVELGLPLSFDGELFIFIDDNVKAQEDRSGTDTDSDPDFKVILDSGPKKKRRCQRPQVSNNEEKWEIAEESKNEVEQEKAEGSEKGEELEMVTKLREQADLIHAIVKGDTECKSYSALRTPGEFQIEFKRWQASELMKVLGNLVSNIEQLSNLVQ